MVQRVEGVICDVGGVLAVVGDPVSRDAWADRLALTVAEFRLVLWEAIGSRGIDRRHEVVHRIQAGFGVSHADAVDLIADLNRHWVPNRELLDYLAELRARIKIGVLSNAPPQARFAMEEVLGLHRRVHELGISAEMGLEKPEPAAYLEIARRLEVPVNRCVFVDDLPGNVRGAQATGMTGILHQSSKTTRARLDRLVEGGWATS